MKMLKLILCLLGCLFSLSIGATDKADLNDAVSMVSYEQRWLDYNGTIALKNNTDTDIHNVNFIVCEWCPLGFRFAVFYNVICHLLPYNMSPLCESGICLFC